MSATNIVSLNYHHHDLEAIQIGSQLWLTVVKLTTVLGHSDYRQTVRLYERNKHQFAMDETRVIPLQTATGVRDSRVFSLRGARLLAMLARTSQADAFRQWVLDVLDGRVQRRRLQQAELALPGTHRLSTEAVRALDEGIGLLDVDSPARQRLIELRDGKRPLSDDPTMDRLVGLVREGSALMAQGNRLHRQAAQEAAQAGYTLDGVKAAARREARHVG